MKCQVLELENVTWFFVQLRTIMALKKGIIVVAGLKISVRTGVGHTYQQSNQFSDMSHFQIMAVTNCV